MLSLRHRRFRRDVHRLIDGELPNERLAELQSHLDACSDCRKDLRWWIAVRLALHAPSPP